MFFTINQEWIVRKQINYLYFLKIKVVHFLSSYCIIVLGDEK